MRKWRPPWHRQVRWWNLAIGVVFIAALFAVILPLGHPEYRQGFSGNLVSSAWQLIATAIVGWIALRRFRAERLKKAMSISWNEPFRRMKRIAGELYPSVLADGTKFRSALTPDVRKALQDAKLCAERRAML